MRAWRTAVTVWLAAAIAALAGMVSNGGFEDGVNGWNWEQWKQLPQPGYLDREGAFEGKACYALTEPGQARSRSLLGSIRGIKPGQAYLFSLALACKDVPEKAVEVRLLQWGTEAGGAKAKPQGWVEKPGQHGVVDLVKTGGTHGWETYQLRLPAASIKDSTTHLTLFITHTHADQGVVRIDAVSFEPVADAVASKPAAVEPAPEATVFTAAKPWLLAPARHSPLTIDVSPEQSLYRTGKLPEVKVVTIGKGTVSWQVLDGFGTVLANGDDQPAGGDAAVALPPGHGYYEVVATLRQPGQPDLELRRSIGVLDPPAPAVGDEPFGLWVQGGNDYTELGVRWIRTAFYYNLWHKDPAAYLQQVRDRIAEYHEQGIRVLVYPKDMPKGFDVTQKVLADTPEAWAALTAWWKSMIVGLKGQPDLWGVINEPYRGMWRGNDDLIIRYWSLMRKLIDENDPKTPLIGPSLNTNAPHMMAQMDDLVKLGLPKLIDGIELHTYTAGAMPEDVDWAGHIAQTRAIVNADGIQRPIYSSEMGTSVDYDHELEQAQYLTRCFLWAKRMDLKMIMWHMYSWPQGPGPHQTQFAIFRNGKNKETPQPRPAGVAYGVMTRQLAGARFVHEVADFGASVQAFVFERRGEPLLVIWSTDPRPRTLTVSVGVPTTTATDIFGAKSELTAQAGVVTLGVSPSPVYLSPVSPAFLKASSSVLLSMGATLLPGKSVAGTLSLTNPTGSAVKATVTLTPRPGWQVSPPTFSAELPAKGSTTQALTVACPPGWTPGEAVLNGQVVLGKLPALPLNLPLTVAAPLSLGDVQPGLVVEQVPCLEATVARADPSITEAWLTADVPGAKPLLVQFGDHDQATVKLPLPGASPEALQAVKLTLEAGQARPVEASPELSFVGVPPVKGKVTIDGKLDDWPAAPPTRGDWSVRWRWTPEALYLAVVAKDATHVQERSPDTMWMQDSIQVAIAPLTPAGFIRSPLGEMHESPYTELSIALNGGKTVVYRHTSPNGELAPAGVVTEGITAAVVHADGITTYEARLPLDGLGLKPVAPGQVVRASVLLNCSDGGRRTWREWFSGIARGKNPALYGHLVLLAE